MPRFINIQDNFSSGELGPFIKSRLNLDVYKNGVDQAYNFLPMKEGPIVRRPGSTYLGQITHLTGLYDSPAIASQTVQDVHFIPYQESSTNAYIVAIVKLQTRTVIQFYSYTGQYFSPLVTSYPTDWELAASSWIPSLGTLIPTDLDIHKFQYAQYGNLLFLTHESGNIAPIVIAIFNNSGTYKVAVNYMYDFVYGGTYAAITGNLAEITSSTTKYPLNNLAPLIKVPYSPVNSNQITITANEIVPTTSYTLTASQPIFSQGMIGSLVKLTRGSTTTTYKITGYTSTSVLQATRTNYTYGSYDPTATKLWEFQAWNSAWGHPRCVTFFEQRMVMASTSKYPDTLWFSNTGNIFLFMQNKLAQDLASDSSGVNYYGSKTASDPFDLGIASDTVNKIQWLNSGRSLYAGTIGAEYVIKSGQSGLAYNSFSIAPETEVGSSYVKPIRIDNSVVYVHKNGHNIHQLTYSEANGSNVSKDLTLQFGKWEFDYSSYPSNLKVEQLALNKDRSCIFALFRNNDTSNSFIKSILLDQTAAVLGASTIVLSGDKDVKSLICLPNADTLKDNLVMLVKRTYNGTTYFSVEELHDDFDKTTLTNYENATDISVQTAYAPVLLDCARIYAGVSVGTINHPVLKNVNAGLSALINGILYEGLSSDASGNITLPVSGTVIIVGLPFTSRIKTLAPNLGGFGNNDGRMSRKRIDKIFVEYRNTKHLMVGTSLTNLLSLEIDTDYANNVNLYSGNKSKAIMNSSEENGQVIISTDKPYPVTILQVGIRGMTEEI